jgi:superfamily I DNA/RNA helicase
VNYRTTEQIRRFATAILEDVEIDDLDDGLDPLGGYRSLVDGQPPSLTGFASAAEEASWVADEIERLAETGLASQDICIVGRTGPQCHTLEKELSSRGKKFYKISRDSADNHNISGVRLSNMHRIKGLEFRVVFLVGVKAGVIPFQRALDETDDPVEQRKRELTERALFHVAGTRAVNGLYVTWHGEPSRYLST